MEPKTAELVVMAIVYLHIFLRQSKYSNSIYMPTKERLDEEDEEQLITLLPIQNIAHKSSVIAKDIRDELSDYFYTNGSVPWQYEC